MLCDLPQRLGETIPDFHNMELRIRQLRDAVAADPVGRAASVAGILADIERRADAMCFAERLHRKGSSPSAYAIAIRRSTICCLILLQGSLSV